MSPSDPISFVKDVSGVDRRTFCACAVALATATACGGGGGGTAAPPAAPPPPGPVTTTDTKTALLATVDGTTRDYRNVGGFFLIKDATGIYAMTTVCTHMGCTVGLPVSNQIVCPCHSSTYDMNGGNLVGPAAIPLVHYAVTEPTPGAFLVVNKAQTVSPSARLT